MGHKHKIYTDTHTNNPQQKKNPPSPCERVKHKIKFLFDSILASAIKF